MTNLRVKKIIRSVSGKCFYISVIAFITLLVLFEIIDAYKDDKLKELNTLETSNIFVKDLLKNNSKLNFISAHLFKGSSHNFDEYIKKNAEENHIKITGSSCIEKTKLKSLKKSKIKIEGICWHDLNIFKFIESINKFSPGFARVKQIEINKLAKISIYKPVIKMEITCEIFNLK